MKLYRRLWAVRQCLRDSNSPTVTTVTLSLAERGLPPYIYRWEKTKTKISINEKQLFVHPHKRQAVALFVFSNIYQLAKRKIPTAITVGRGLRRRIVIGSIWLNGRCVRRFVLRKNDLTLFKQFQYPFIVVAY